MRVQSCVLLTASYLAGIKLSQSEISTRRNHIPYSADAGEIIKFEGTPEWSPVPDILIIFLIVVCIDNWPYYYIYVFDLFIHLSCKSLNSRFMSKIN